MGALRAVIQTFHRKGIIDAPRRTDPTVDSWFIQVKPSSAA